MTTASDRYLRPGFFTQHVFNPAMKGLTGSASACGGRTCSPSGAAGAASGGRCR
jgi:hypothetical protein